jgi:hypothetical protein
MQERFRVGCKARRENRLKFLRYDKRENPHTREGEVVHKRRRSALLPSESAFATSGCRFSTAILVAGLRLLMKYMPASARSPTLFDLWFQNFSAPEFFLTVILLRLGRFYFTEPLA